ncbi:hypothetical protein HK102_001946, partial [Quaeritorhiza haematococci]
LPLNKAQRGGVSARCRSGPKGSPPRRHQEILWDRFDTEHWAPLVVHGEAVHWTDPRHSPRYGSIPRSPIHRQKEEERQVPEFRDSHLKAQTRETGTALHEGFAA